SAIELLESEQLPMLPVVDPDGLLVGVFSAHDALQARENPAVPLSEVLQLDPAIARPGDSLYQALERMTHTMAPALPVVDDRGPGHLVGYLSMSALSRALEQHVSDLRVRPEALRSAFDDPFRYVLVEEAMTPHVEHFPADMPF